MHDTAWSVVFLLRTCQVQLYVSVENMPNGNSVGSVTHEVTDIALDVALGAVTLGIYPATKKVVEKTAGYLKCNHCGATQTYGVGTGAAQAGAKLGEAVGGHGRPGAVCFKDNCRGTMVHTTGDWCR